MEPAITERSRERTNAWLAALEDRWGQFERVEKRWELPRARYERDRRRVERGENGGAGGWITDRDGRVLLVRNEGDDGWSDPGGKREADESFEDAARREVREETGVECRLTGVLEAHVLRLAHESDPDRPELVSLIVVFEAEHVAGDPRPEVGEIAAVRWFDRPPETVRYPAVARWPYPASDSGP